MRPIDRKKGKMVKPWAVNAPHGEMVMDRGVGVGGGESRTSGKRKSEREGVPSRVGAGHRPGRTGSPSTRTAIGEMWRRHVGIIHV